MQISTVLYKESKIHIRHYGTGPAVVFLHGFMESQGMWNFAVGPLAKKYQIITLDQLGHGKTTFVGPTNTMEQMAEAVKTVLDTLKVAEVLLIGHSLGGYVSLAFAEAYPERVRGMMLFHSHPFADSKQKQEDRLRSIAAADKAPERYIRTTFHKLFWESNRKRYAAAVEQALQEALATPKEGLLATLEGMRIRKDRRHILENTSFHNHLVIGAHDTAVPSEGLRELNVPKTIFEECGHMGHIEERETSLEVISRFCDDAWKKTH